MNKEKFLSNIHLKQHNFVRLNYSYLDCRGYLESEVDSFSVGSCSQTAKKGQKEHNCESILHKKNYAMFWGFFSYVL